MRTPVIILLLIGSVLSLKAQHQLDLTSAIRLGITGSPEFAQAQAELTASQIQSKVIRMRFLPSITSSLVLPNYSRSTTTVTIPDGRSIFVTQNQALYNADLSIEQDEPWLGGRLAVSTNYNRIDIFGNLRSTSYFSSPVLFSYTNSNLFARPYQFEKRIDAARMSESYRRFNERLEELAYQVATYYLEAFSLGQQLEVNLHNREELITIHDIARQRLVIGTLMQSDLLAVESNALDLEISINRLRSQQNWNEERIKEHTGIGVEEDLVLASPGIEILGIEVPLELALEKSRTNGVARSNRDLRTFENEQELSDLRAKRKISLSVNAFYGLSNTAPTFQRSTTELQDQQLYTVGLRYTLFDFGRSAQQLRLLSMQREIIQTGYQAELSAEEREVRRQVQLLSDLQSELILLEQKMVVVRKRFALLRDRFTLGTVTMTELSIGQTEVQQAQIHYHETLKNCWLTYYGIRRLTLYDFAKNRDINYLE